MPRDGRVALGDIAGLREDCTDGAHLPIRQPVDAMQLLEQSFILLLQRRVFAENGYGQNQERTGCEPTGKFHGFTSVARRHVR
jgi:hypothetical protein